MTNVSGQLKVNTLGQVGIGKDPKYKLDVSGDAYVTGNIYLGTTLNSLSTVSNASMSFKVNNGVVGFLGNYPSYRVSFGYSAASTGDYNVAIGPYALSQNTSGTYNTAIGSRALYYNTTGGSNVAIGNGADVSAQNLSNATAIGSATFATSSNQVRIGSSSVSSIGGYAAWSNISDGRIKKNIRMDVPGLAFINSLQPVTYNVDLDAVDGLLGIDRNNETLSEELIAINRKAREAKEKQVQTGFIAQDVEKTAKSLGYDFSGVDVDEIGIYGLRYAEFVVPLVKTADIYIFNMQGNIVKKIAADRSGMIEIQGSELQAGMYLYSLVADGKEVDTKRMILTK